MIQIERSLLLQVVDRKLQDYLPRFFRRPFQVWQLRPFRIESGPLEEM
jgi:hypothetical protein